MFSRAPGLPACTIIAKHSAKFGLTLRTVMHALRIRPLSQFYVSVTDHTNREYFARYVFNVMAIDGPMRQAALEFWESNGGCVSGDPAARLQARHSQPHCYSMAQDT